MNDYGAGTLLDDYRFLEDVSRKVSEWGKGIADPKLGGSKGHRGARGGRAKPNEPTQQGRHAPLPANLAQLRRAAASKGFDIIFVPDGMQRRLANKSYYQSSSKTLFLDVTLIFRLSSGWQQALSALPKLAMHKNSTSDTLLELLQSKMLSQISASTRKDISAALAVPRSLSFVLRVPPMLAQSLPAVSAQPQSTDGQLIDRSRSGPTAERPVSIWRLDGDVPLIDALNGCACIEWPEIEIWTTLSLEQAIREGRVDVRSRQASMVVGEERSKPSLPAVIGEKRKSEALVDYGSSADDEVIDGELNLEDTAAHAVANAAASDLASLTA